VSHLVIATMLKGLKGELVQRESVREGKNGTIRTTVYEARLGWATLLFKVIHEGKDVNGGGNRFELILPKGRSVPNPLSPDGAPLCEGKG
jgi:hypothetical protein